MASCPWTCGPNRGLSCNYILSNAQGTVRPTCAGLESNGCDCSGCSMCGLFDTPSPTPAYYAPTTTSFSDATTTVAVPPPGHWIHGGPTYYSNYDIGLYNSYYYLDRSNTDTDTSASSMLWIIISIAAVFVFVTGVLGFVVYRRRQARLRALAARQGGGQRRVVTQIELEEVESLPYVERVHDEPDSAAYPVAQSLTVVDSRSPSRSPSRQTSFAHLDTHVLSDDDDLVDEEAAQAAAHNEEAYTPGGGRSPMLRGRVRTVAENEMSGLASDNIPVATASLTSLHDAEPGHEERERAESVASVGSLGEQPASPRRGFTSWTFNANGGGEAGNDSDDDSDDSVTPRSPAHARFADEADYADTDNQMAFELMSGSGEDEVEEDDEIRLARALSLSMQQAYDEEPQQGDNECVSTSTLPNGGGGAGNTAADVQVVHSAPLAMEDHAATHAPQCVEDDIIVQLESDGEDDVGSEETADLASSSDEGGDGDTSNSAAW
eukprot:INCI4909.1.p1 GENE.INCI4909.1~~INCI4909.1.p1  ORF type:complete len:493 (-),score=100.38 INCI4909.1:123-1601(-)